MILEKLQNGFAWRLLHALVGLQILTSEGALEYWLAPSGGTVICGKLEQQRKGDRLGMSRNAWMNGRELQWAAIGSKRICMYLAYNNYYISIYYISCNYEWRVNQCIVYRRLCNWSHWLVSRCFQAFLFISVHDAAGRKQLLPRSNRH